MKAKTCQCVRYLAEITTVKTGDDSTFRHDVTIVPDAAKSGQIVICILNDDTYVFVLLVYLVNWADMYSARYRSSSGMDQYLTPMPPLLTLVRNACS